MSTAPAPSKHEVLTLRHPEGGMAAWACWPGGSEPAPAILVMEHALGIDPFMEAMGLRLAEAGYATLIPDLYHRFPLFETPFDKMKRLSDREIVRDLAIARTHLTEDPRVDATRIGVIGFCMGGRIALRALEARELGLQAGVCYYGGHLHVGWGTDATAPFDLLHKIEAPLLFHFGGEDTNPSPQDRHDLDRALTRLNKPHTFYDYAGAGHAFMDFTRPERYRKEASEISWERTLRFLGEEFAHRP